jgi:signal transduction histidine kinase/DNA-binding response OmpR family regulator
VTLPNSPVSAKPDDLEVGNENTLRYATWGALFGLCFPVFSTFFEAWIRFDSVAPGALIDAQRSSQLLWVIDSAPLFLGWFASLAGRKQDTVEASFHQLQSTYDRLRDAHDRLGASAERLQLALDAKGEFLAKMSHELRTPLNVVIGFSRILLERSADKLEKRAQRHLSMVHESGQHLLSLVNDMLDLERIEAGRLKVNKGPVDVGELVRSLHEALKPQAEAGGYKFEVSTPDVPVRMTTDPDRLRQVLSNLVNNAIKYAGEGDITLSLDVTDDKVRFGVDDTGQGIPEDQLRAIFDPFHQIDNSNTRGKDGAGLGLSIVQRIAELLDGKVRVESVLGEGATFWVEFPGSLLLEDSQNNAPAPRADPGTDKEYVAFDSDSGEHEVIEGAPRILVIDDKKELLELIRHELRAAGYKVDVAAGGEAGLRAAKEKRPDAIVLDIIMPKVDGWEVLRRLRADPELSSTPVVVSSMLDNEPRAADFAVAAWLTKPFDAGDLRRVLAQHTAGDTCNDVLIVEDDANTRALLETSLRDHDVEVRLAATGAAANVELDKALPCAMILDLGLPDISGFEVLRGLRERENGGAVSVIVYTGRDLDSEESAQLKDDLAQVIEKHAARGVDGVVDTVQRALGAAATRAAKVERDKEAAS